MTPVQLSVLLICAGIAPCLSRRTAINLAELGIEDDIGLWVVVQHHLTAKNKSRAVQNATYGRDGFSWMPDMGITELVAGMAPDSKYMDGLGSELLPEVLNALQSKGIRAYTSHLKVKDDSLAFLLSIDGINARTFLDQNILDLRAGVLDSLMGRVPGKDSLEETLAKLNVPANVDAFPDPNAAEAFEIAITIDKHNLLRLQIPDKLPTSVPDFLRNSQIFADFIGKYNPKDALSSKAIADAMCGDMEKTMSEKLLENGLVTTISAAPTEQNGGRNDEKRKIIDVQVNVLIAELDKAIFESVQMGTLQDAVYQQLLADGEGGLEVELAAKNFPAGVVVTKCGGASDSMRSCLPAPHGWRA